jgi:hypothetical protein
VTGVQELLRIVAERTGTRLTQPAPDRIEVEAVVIPLPQRPAGTKGDWWEQFDLRSAFPSRAQGDQREKLFYTIVQDGSTAANAPRRRDDDLLSALPTDIPLEGATERDRAVLSAAMQSEYWVKPTKRPFVLPYHSALPLRFRHNLGASSGYRMFNGSILPFLCWTNGKVDAELIGRVLSVFNETGGFTLLDELLLETVDLVAPGEPSESHPERLIERSRGALENLRIEGPFCQPSLDLFQRDLRTVAGMKLSRRDLIEALTHVLSLHLAIHYYRIALVLGEEVDRAIAASASLPEPEGGCDCTALRACSLAGRIRFRIGSTGYRPISQRDPCAVAYRDLDAQRLLALAGNIATANLAQHIWQHLGGPASQRPLTRDLAAAVGIDAELRRRFDAAAAGFAAVIAGDSSEQDGGVVRRGPGLHSLREAILLEAGRNDLRHRSRDVVNQLAKRERGALLHTNGGTTFFELDETFLSLIVKLICRDGAVPFEQFLEGLCDYGLVPQHDGERDRLASTLERLEMLHRYSDSGESAFVRHPL